MSRDQPRRSEQRPSTDLCCTTPSKTCASLLRLFVAEYEALLVRARATAAAQAAARGLDVSAVEPVVPPRPEFPPPYLMLQVTTPHSLLLVSVINMGQSVYMFICCICSA